MCVSASQPDSAPVWLLWLQAVGRRGIGLVIMPDAATLPPWGALRVDLACCTDMCGQYADVLHCQVSLTDHHAGARPQQTDTGGAAVKGYKGTSCCPGRAALDAEAARALQPQLQSVQVQVGTCCSHTTESKQCADFLC